MTNDEIKFGITVMPIHCGTPRSIILTGFELGAIYSICEVSRAIGGGEPLHTEALQMFAKFLSVNVSADFIRNTAAFISAMHHSVNENPELMEKYQAGLHGLADKVQENLY